LNLNRAHSHTHGTHGSHRRTSLSVLHRRSSLRHFTFGLSPWHVRRVCPVHLRCTMGPPAGSSTVRVLSTRRVGAPTAPAFGDRDSCMRVVCFTAGWVQRQGFVHARRVFHSSSAMGPRTFPSSLLHFENRPSAARSTRHGRAIVIVRSARGRAHARDDAVPWARDLPLDGV